jgi:hypothetical protein
MSAVEKSDHRELLAVDSSSTVLLHPQRRKAQRLGDLDGNGKASGWPVIVRKVASGGDSNRGEMSKVNRERGWRRSEVRKEFLLSAMLRLYRQRETAVGDKPVVTMNAAPTV